MKGVLVQFHGDQSQSIAFLPESTFEKHNEQVEAVIRADIGSWLATPIENYKLKYERYRNEGFVVRIEDEEGFMHENEAYSLELVEMVGFG